MTDRFLLYVDLLGFKDIVRTEKHIIPDLLRILDKSKSHNHGDFEGFLLSDTLLIYNKSAADTDRWKSYCAMYLCEFAQDIQYMLLGHKTFFRGMITYGQFEDTGPTPNMNYKHIRSLWGEALVKAYQTEKDIQAVGLFIDETVKPFMNIFETHLYDSQKDIWFVDTATMLRGKLFNSRDFTYAKEDAIASATENLLAYDLVYLKQLFSNGHDQSLPPKVRNKYLTTWEFYRQKYKGLCAALEEADFRLEQVIKLDWEPFLRKIGTPR